LLTSEIRRRHVIDVRQGLGDTRGGALDVVLSGPGGDLEGAYLVARELRRRFEQVSVYVPFIAKSAATLIALAADELILGDLGELGPLDAQNNEKQHADFPVTVSGLRPFKALEQLDLGVLNFYDAVVSRVVDKGGMRLFDACGKAAELSSDVYKAMYSQIDPQRLAECARELEVGSEYSERILRRYRPEVFERNGRKIIHRLVHAYPSHGFVLDVEELQELELPVRLPGASDAAIVDEIASALMAAGEPIEHIELVMPAAPHPGRGADEPTAVESAVRAGVAPDADAGARTRRHSGRRRSANAAGIHQEVEATADSDGVAK
jgi:hypothetical protein